MIEQCEGMTRRGTRCRRAAGYLVSSLPDRSDVEAACDEHAGAVARRLEAASGRRARTTPNFDVAEFAAYVARQGT